MFDEFSGAANVMHVAPNGSDTNPANDGSTWAKAKKTIQGAIDAKGEDVLIIVSPGEWTGSDALCEIEGSNVTLVGAGPGTRISGDNELGIVRYREGYLTVQDLYIQNAKPAFRGDSYAALFRDSLVRLSYIRIVLARSILVKT